MVGRTEPRRFTPPLRELTPETSDGFACIEFAEKVLGLTLLPWQKWIYIHALELNPDGSYRFRVVLVLVARQNGKTFLVSVLALFRLYVDYARLVLGTHHTLEGARGSLKRACELVQYNPWVNGKQYRGIGNERLELIGNANIPDGAEYVIRAANESAGRGLSVDLLIMDELLKQRNFDAWNALKFTTQARKKGQTFCISTPGGVEAVLLNHLHDQGLAALADGSHADPDNDLGFFEYSAPEDAELTDPEGWAQANPALGHENGIGYRTILGSLKTDPPQTFKTEVLCQRVPVLDGALDMAAWAIGLEPGSTFNRHRERLSLCLDVSMSLRHATLCAATQLPDGKVRVGVLAAWSGESTMNDLRRDLPDLIEKIKPRRLGWFPNGPAAGIAAELKNVRRAEPFKATEVPQACMGLAELVTARRVLHNGDALLAAHGKAAQKMPSGDGWKFRRRDAGDIDAIYAAAGAVHLARMTKPLQPLKMVVI